MAGDGTPDRCLSLHHRMAAVNPKQPDLAKKALSYFKDEYFGTKFRLCQKIWPEVG